MASLRIENLGKKFYSQWIFRDLSFSISANQSLLVKGPNGSGKSTLLRCIAGQLTPTKGKLALEIDGKEIPSHQFYRHIAWTGPYFDLYGDLSLAESVHMHFRFRESLGGSPDDIIRALRFEKHRDKAVKHFSSGMLHRLKVGLALYTRAPLLLLDEPGSNLDEENAHYIYSRLDELRQDRILIFVSNDPREFVNFEQQLDLKAYT